MQPQVCACEYLLRHEAREGGCLAEAHCPSLIYACVIKYLDQLNISIDFRFFVYMCIYTIYLVAAGVPGRAAKARGVPRHSGAERRYAVLGLVVPG